MENNIYEDTISRFTRLDKAAKEMYSNENQLQAGLDKPRSRVYDTNKLINKEFNSSSLLKELNNPENLAKLSATLYSVDPLYSTIIDYYGSLYKTIYTVIPFLTDDSLEIDDETYKMAYNKMVGVADGLSLEINMVRVIKTALIEGAAYVYAEKEKSTETMRLTLLPFEFSKIVARTSFGTNQIRFDNDYFKSLANKINNVELFEQVLTLYPKEMQKNYRTYESNKFSKEFRYMNLNPSNATAFSFNELTFPPKLSVLYALEDYEKYRANEIKKNSNQLNKVFTHQIPVNSDGETIFDMEEIAVLHKNMRKVFSKEYGIDFLTTFGKTEILDVQTEKTVNVDPLISALKTVYDSVGLNSNLFIADNPSSIELSIVKDEAYMLPIIQEFNRFINIVLNRAYKSDFEGMLIDINILPITHYNHSRYIADSLKSAQFGIGKLDAIVISGTKQNAIPNKLKLEGLLELDVLLTPLSSSHTNSGVSGVSNQGQQESNTSSKEVKTNE